MHGRYLMVMLNIVFVSALTCDELLELPPEKKINFSEIQAMLPKDIVQCLAHLGKEELTALEAEFVWNTLITYFDGIQNIPDSVLMRLHWVTTAISPEDYENITLNNIDVIENFGLNYKLDEKQIAAIAERVREDFAGKDPEDYTYYDLTALRQILCAFNRSEIERISPLAYKETALIIGKLERCNSEVMSGFASLAIQKHAFGAVDYWTAATIKNVGKVAEYLPDEFIKKFNIERKVV